jgi:hypothetical protein
VGSKGIELAARESAERLLTKHVVWINMMPCRVEFLLDFRHVELAVAPLLACQQPVCVDATVPLLRTPGNSADR